MTDGPVYRVVCTDCQHEATYPNRETAEHAGRVHERSHDHRVDIVAVGE
jgi:hypothetical protein